jgi:hypothetical protein
MADFWKLPESVPRAAVAYSETQQAGTGLQTATLPAADLKSKFHQVCTALPNPPETTPPSCQLTLCRSVASMLNDIETYKEYKVPLRLYFSCISYLSLCPKMCGGDHTLFVKPQIW